MAIVAKKYTENVVRVNGANATKNNSKRTYRLLGSASQWQIQSFITICTIEKECKGNENSHAWIYKSITLYINAHRYWSSSSAKLLLTNKSTKCQHQMPVVCKFSKWTKKNDSVQIVGKYIQKRPHSSPEHILCSIAKERRNLEIPTQNNYFMMMMSKKKNKRNVFGRGWKKEIKIRFYRFRQKKRVVRKKCAAPNRIINDVNAVTVKHLLLCWWLREIYVSCGQHDVIRCVCMWESTDGALCSTRWPFGRSISLVREQ